MSYRGAAWKGELLVGLRRGEARGRSAAQGASTVSRYHRSPALREMASTLAKALEITGILFGRVRHRRLERQPLLLGINRRITANTHRGSAYDVDPCKALLAALHGLPATTRTDFDEGEEHIGVHFPQEWLRDPESRWLRDYPSILPWEEPELIEAMIALRRG